MNRPAAPRASPACSNSDASPRAPFEQAAHPRLKLAVSKIIVRGVNWLGDAVMSTPALLQLRAAYPNAHIALLTPAKLADLWMHHPAINAVLPLEPHASPWQTGRQLRPHRFDLGILLPNSPRSALELWWGRVPRRMGYATPWRRWLLTEAVAQRPGHVAMRKRSTSEIRSLITGGSPAHAGPSWPAAAHHIHHYLELVAAAGADPTPLAPHIAVTQGEIEAAARRFGLPQPCENAVPVLGLNAGAEYGPSKRWPPDSFVAAALALRQRLGCHWVVFGGHADVAQSASIAAAIAAQTDLSGHDSRADVPRVFNLAGRTSLRELCATLRLCRVLITNDTGPMHVAAAVGTPVVVPFGSTSPELTGPGLPKDPRHRLLCADVPCRPCFRRDCPIDFRCMRSISVERIVTAVIGLAAVARQSDIDDAAPG